MALADKTCIPCRGGIPPLTRAQFLPLLSELEGWEVSGDRKLVKTFAFRGFKKPMELANKIADLSQEQGHHPDLHIRWGELSVEIWTHKIGGLSESDFILAAKIDQLSDPKKGES